MNVGSQASQRIARLQVVSWLGSDDTREVRFLFINKICVLENQCRYPSAKVDTLDVESFG